MEARSTTALYRIWGADKVLYGPFDLARLGQWMNQARLDERGWVFLEPANEWKRAGELPELKSFFSEKQGRIPPRGQGAKAKSSVRFAPEALRRIELFANLEEPQLESFVNYLEAVPCPQFSHIVRKGERGEAMYLVLEGEVRALTIVDGKESTLATITAGDWFGEISLLDYGPRSADIIANQDSLLLKLSSEAFKRLLGEAPMLAVPFLLALCRTVAARIRGATKRYEDSVRFIRTTGTAR